MITYNINLPKLYPKQAAVFFDKARVSACEASTKAGKSVGGLVWQLSLCLNTGDNKGMSHLWIEPVHSQAAVMFARVCRWLMASDPEGRIWSANKTDLIITFSITGARWFFKGSENYDSIYGSDYGSVVIDEASRCREEVWAAAWSTLTATGGPIRTIGNVNGRKNWNYRLCRRAEAGEPGYAYHKLTVHDAVEAGVIKPEQIEEARRALPDAVFRELYLAEASEDGSNPFGIQHIQRCILPEQPGPIVGWGVDLAKSQDWTVVVGLNQLGQTSMTDRWQGPWHDTTERLVKLIGDTPALVDSTGVGDPIVEQLQRRCPLVEGQKFTSQSKQQMMEGLAVAIQNGAVTFPDGPITNELEQFEYEYTRTGVRYSAPEGVNDDCVCALALAVKKHGGVTADGGFRVVVAKDTWTKGW